MRNYVFGFMFLLCLPLLSRGGGYQVNLVGVRYIGMGHVGTSLAMDAGTIFFNPGNLSLLKEKYSFTGSASLIFASTAFQSFNTNKIEKTDNHLEPPFSAFGSVKITDRFSAGLGIYTPFGSSVRWDPNWSGKFLVQDISLKTVLVQPTASYKINDWLSVGAGLVFAYGKVNLTRAISPTFAGGKPATTNLKGHDTNWGFNAGVGIHPTEKLGIGLSYRSKINMRVAEGDATFTVPGSISSNFPTDGKFRAAVPLPANGNFGINYQFTEKLMIAADFNYVWWSSYDSLNFDFIPTTSAVTNSHNPKKYKNSFIVRLGGQYKISDMVTARAGLYYDKSPVRANLLSPETPDADRMGFSGGVSVFPTDRLSIDASFLYVNEFQRTASYDPAGFKGTYKSHAFIPGLGLTYSF